MPSSAALSEMGAAMREALAAYFEELNSRGGVHGRKIELKVIEGGATPAATVANVSALSAREPVFAVVGGISAGADTELAALAEREGLPFVGPSTLIPAAGASRRVFYILPGATEQARALVNFAAASPALKGARLGVIASESELTSAAAARAEEQAKRAGISALPRVSYPRGKLDAARAVSELKKAGASVLVVLGEGGDAAALLREAAAAGWSPHVLTPAIFTERDFIASVPAAFKERVFVAFPSAPQDVTQAGAAELGELLGKYKVARRHVASQLSAVAAAKVFAEALRLAGRELTRDALVSALEGLRDFDTGLTPRVSFGPGRRVGAAGAYVLTVDTESRKYVRPNWVNAE